MVDNCTTIKYPVAWGFKREPARPVNLRLDYCGGMKFNDNFDWDNMWYDAIQVNNTTVLLIGPPLYDTKIWMQNNVTFEDTVGNKLIFNSIELDRVCYTAVVVSGHTEYIEMVTATERTRIKINRNNDNLNNKTVMVTLQKNNPTEWIKQWITFHQKLLNVNAFLIYDNNSTIYNINQLETALQGLGAIVNIVSWPYPYGPQGSDYAPWDSDYSQYVMLEHAKLRYLSNSSLVMNNDIDELVVLKNITLRDVIDFLRNNTIQCLKYKGIWIQPISYHDKISANTLPFNLRHIKDYYCTDPTYTTGIGYKWMLVPSNTNLNQQWLVHHINGQMLESDQLFYGHFLSHNTNWSWERDKFKGDVNNLVPNQFLVDKFSKLD